MARDEKEAIELITGKFTKVIWDHAIIVFTRAAKVKNFKTAVENRSRVVRAAIAEHGLAGDLGQVFGRTAGSEFPAATGHRLTSV